MKIALFSIKSYDEEFFKKSNKDFGFELSFFETKLNINTVELAKGHDAICAFVNDDLSSEILTVISNLGIKLILMRCAGFNNIDLKSATELGITIMRVPEYSPYAVAEHTLGMILNLSRKFHKAYNRTREGNFSLNGLMGFELSKKTIGLIGTGKIAQVLIKILNGFGAKVIAYDPYPLTDKGDLDFEYTQLEELYRSADIISMHCPLNDKTFHMINSETISQMKDGVIIVNTSRGGLLHTKDLIQGLKTKKIAGLAIDVYEEEADIFFEDKSTSIIEDDSLMRLLSFPNVLVTGHQAFFTDVAMNNIVETTLNNAQSYLSQKLLDKNLVTAYG